MNLVNESFLPFLNEDILIEEYLNENFNLDSIKDIGKKAVIISSIFLSLLNISGEKKENLKHVISSSPIVLNLAKQSKITKEDIEKIFKELMNINFIKNNFINPNFFKDPLTLLTSHQGKNFIKHHEKLKLKAYKLSDGKITIGYGHAEPESISKYKEGDIISKNQAELIFLEDLKIAENGIKRIFKKWKEEGNDIKLTQHMWDSMVSLAFNMGVGALRNTKLIQTLKYKDYFKAAELIPQTRISKKFSGLEKRREKEKELFLRGL